MEAIEVEWGTAGGGWEGEEVSLGGEQITWKYWQNWYNGKLFYSIKCEHLTLFLENSSLVNKVISTPSLCFFLIFCVEGVTFKNGG